MRFEAFLNELKEAHENLEVFTNKEQKVIQEEIVYLNKLYQKLFPFASKKDINGEESLLIYKFSSEKEWISTEAYYDGKKYIKYQVYDEEKYRGFVRDADIHDGFVRMPIEKFLVHVPLKEIFQFFLDRPNFLYDFADDKRKKNKEREAFLSKIKHFME